jgi:hypothetical protein
MTDKKPDDHAEELGDDIDNFEFHDTDFDLKKSVHSDSTLLNQARSRMPLVIGSVLGVFLIYKGVDWFFLSHKKPAPPEATTAIIPTEQNATALPDTTLSTDNKGAEDAMAFLSELKQQHPPPQSTLAANAVLASTAPTVASDVAAPIPTTPVATTAPDAPAAPISTLPATPDAAAPLPAATPDTPAIMPPQGLPADVVGQLQQKLDGQTEETDKRLEAMDRAIYRLSKRMEQVQDSVGQMGHDMSGINQSLTLLAKEMKKMGEPIDAPLKNEITKTDTFSSPNYAVYAIIPGRAWLKDKSGRTLTVTEGDVLEQYGKVLVIDAQNSVVITSSGITLR